MGRTLTETRLGDEVVITVSRYRNDQGALDYKAAVQATTLTDDGLPVMTATVSVGELVQLGLLDPVWVESVKPVAAALVAAMAQHLAVAEA